MANEKISDIIAQARDVFDEIRKHGHDVVSLDRMADIIDRILAANEREIGELKGERKGLLKANEAFAADNTRLRGEVAAKDAEIEKLKATLKTCVYYIKCEYGCGSECDAACEEIESGCNLRQWTIEFGLETLGRKGGE